MTPEQCHPPAHPESRGEQWPHAPKITIGAIIATATSIAFSVFYDLPRPASTFIHAGQVVALLIALGRTLWPVEITIEWRFWVRCTTAPRRAEAAARPSREVVEDSAHQPDVPVR